MPSTSETCVYTIAHTDTLVRAHEAGGVATFREGRRWATAEKWLTAARESGSRIPVVFAAAEDTTDLIYYGWLEDILLGANGAKPATTFKVVGLTPLPKPLQKKTSLVVAETGLPIPATHIRPYVLCRTPSFLKAFVPPLGQKAEKHDPLVLFSWGYCGWGNATKELLESVDAAEASRGFAPPIFVDVRIRRNVRAEGFVGTAFERTAGASRYRWVPDLGNEAVLSVGGPTRIRNPKAAADLLDNAIEAAAHRRRVLFFCSCEKPLSQGAQCHRVDVSDLVLKEASSRRLGMAIQEWPGGEPLDIALELDEVARKRVLAGATSVRVEGKIATGLAASIPWGSRLLLGGGEHERMLTGPLKFTAGRWVLPVIRTTERDSTFQRNHGYASRESCLPRGQNERPR